MKSVFSWPVLDRLLESGVRLQNTDWGQLSPSGTLLAKTFSRLMSPGFRAKSTAGLRVQTECVYSGHTDEASGAPTQRGPLKRRSRRQQCRRVQDCLWSLRSSVLKSCCSCRCYIVVTMMIKGHDVDAVPGWYSTDASFCGTVAITCIGVWVFLHAHRGCCFCCCCCCCCAADAPTISQLRKQRHLWIYLLPW